MKPGTGRCAVLFPHSVLFRDEEREMRKLIIEADLIDCVLGLGPGLFYNSPMEACVVFCRMEKPPERRGKVLFVDAVHEYVRRQAQSYLSDENIDRIARSCRSAVDEDGFASLVTTADMAAQGFSLSIPLYVQHQDSVSGASSFDEALHDWQESRLRTRKSCADMLRALVKES